MQLPCAERCAGGDPTSFAKMARVRKRRRRHGASCERARRKSGTDRAVQLVVVALTGSSLGRDPLHYH